MNHSVMKRSTKFCRCIKTVRKRVGEKGAIGICVHSILQRKGRTLKKFNCGKKPRLVTQKLKKKGGYTPVTWDEIVELSSRQDESGLEELKRSLGNVDPPGHTYGGEWRKVYTTIRELVNQTPSPVLVDILVKLVELIPPRELYNRPVRLHIESMKVNTNPSIQDAGKSMERALSSQIGGAGEPTWEMIKEISTEIYGGNMQHADSLKSLLKTVDLPSSEEDRVYWLQTFSNLKQAAVSRGGETLLDLLSEVVKKHTGDQYMNQYITLAIESLERQNNPELLSVLNTIRNAAGSSV